MKCYFSDICDGSGEVPCTAWIVDSYCECKDGTPTYVNCLGCPNCDDVDDFQDEYEDE